jgi:hypothetical protein
MKYLIVLGVALLIATSLAARPFVIHQKQPDRKRVLQIQKAMIADGYLIGAPTGRWDKATIDMLAAIAQDHGWQTRHVPDARVLNLLGLGSTTAGVFEPTPNLPGYRNLIEEEKP